MDGTPNILRAGWGWIKVSVQGVVALGGYFATLCWELDFYEANFFFIINFQK